MSRDRPGIVSIDDLFKHLALGSWTTPMDEPKLVTILLLPHQLLLLLLLLLYIKDETLRGKV